MLDASKHFFNKIPTIDYNISDDGTTIKLKNILTRAKVKISVYENDFLIYDYKIRDGQTIEYLAEHYYGNASFSWLIMMVNNMYHLYESWPLEEWQMNEYLTKKYNKSIREIDQMIHHYEDNYGNTIHQSEYLEQVTTTPLATRPRGITVYEWELKNNESKRDIKLLNNKYVNLFMEDFKKLFKSIEGGDSINE